MNKELLISKLEKRIPKVEALQTVFLEAAQIIKDSTDAERLIVAQAFSPTSEFIKNDERRLRQLANEEMWVTGLPESLENIKLESSRLRLAHVATSPSVTLLLDENDEPCGCRIGDAQGSKLTKDILVSALINAAASSARMQQVFMQAAHILQSSTGDDSLVVSENYFPPSHFLGRVW